MVENLSKVVN